MAPGPRVAEHTPARPVRRPKISAMNDAACSWRTKHVADRGPGKGVGEVDVLLTGDAEHTRDALVLQAAHDQVGDSSLVRGHRSRISGRRCNPVTPVATRWAENAPLQPSERW